MKHSLQLKLSQHLTLTPQLQQSIRLLQLSTVELNQELEKYLAENPLLERADLAPDEAARAPLPPGSVPEPQAANAEDSREEHRDEARSLEEQGFADEHTGTPGSLRREDDDREDFTQFAAAEPTLQEHLLQQVSLTGLTERDKRLAALIVGHLDEAGIARSCSSRHSARSRAATPAGSRFCTCFKAVDSSSISRSGRTAAAASRNSSSSLFK